MKGSIYLMHYFAPLFQSLAPLARPTTTHLRVQLQHIAALFASTHIRYFAPPLFPRFTLSSRSYLSSVRVYGSQCYAPTYSEATTEACSWTPIYPTNASDFHWAGIRSLSPLSSPHLSLAPSLSPWQAPPHSAQQLG